MGAVKKIDVHFFFEKKIGLKGRKRLKKFVSDVLIKRGKKANGELRIIFCSDKALLQINRDFLNHDYFTDIITFPFTSPKSKLLDAELYISFDRVKENAATQKSSISKELHRVIFHGCLHLCGLGDKTKAELLKMRRAEDALLNEYFNVPRANVSP